jgi:hypothetical protein
MANLDVSPDSFEGVASVSHSQEDSGDDDNLSPLRTGPPSETSSHEWDKLGESTTEA